MSVFIMALATIWMKKKSAEGLASEMVMYSALKNFGPAPIFGHFRGFLSEILGPKFLNALYFI